MLIPIPNSTFARDTNSMGLVNKDQNGLEEYNMKRRMLATQKQEINSIKEEVNNIKNDMQDIKMLLIKLMEK